MVHFRVHESLRLKGYWRRRKKKTDMLFSDLARGMRMAMRWGYITIIYTQRLTSAFGFISICIAFSYYSNCLRLTFNRHCDVRIYWTGKYNFSLHRRKRGLEIIIILLFLSYYWVYMVYLIRQQFVVLNL